LPEAHTDQINSLSLIDQGFISSSEDKTLKVWQVKDLRLFSASLIDLTSEDKPI
jgi:WD40 repeat protein